MSSEEIKQSDVNNICLTLQQNGEEISISKVKNLLHGGSYSQLSAAIELFKNNPKKAIQHCDISIKSKKHINKINISSDIKKTITNNDNIDLCTLKLRDIIQKHIDKEVDSKIDNANKRRIAAEQKSNSITTEYIALHNRYKSLKATYDALEKTLHLSKNISPQAISQAKIEAQSSFIISKPQSTHDIQFSKLSGNLQCAYDAYNNLILLKISGFDATFKSWKNIFNQGKQGILKATCTYNYKTKYWEVSNYNRTTIKVLAQNNGSLSKEVEKLFQKLKKT